VPPYGSTIGCVACSGGVSPSPPVAYMFVTAMSIAIADKTPAGNRWENPWNFAQNRLRVSAVPASGPASCCYQYGSHEVSWSWRRRPPTPYARALGARLISGSGPAAACRWPDSARTRHDTVCTLGKRSTQGLRRGALISSRRTGPSWTGRLPRWRC